MNNKYDSEWHREYFKKWYDENKNKHLNYCKSKVECECGKLISRCSMSHHKKSKKHNKIVGNKILDPKLTETSETVNN